MNNHQIKQNVLAYVKRNGKINDREIISMCVSTDIIRELVSENQLRQVKPGVYQIVKSSKVEQNKMF